MILLSLALACSTPQFTQEWLVDRTRVLAVRADPPEAAPGATVTLSALVVDPAGDPTVAWMVCTVPIDCPDYAAIQGLAAADTSTMTAEELATWQAEAAAAGFLGFGVALSPTLIVMGGGPPPGDSGGPDTGDTASIPTSSDMTLVLDAIPVGKELADVTLGDPEATELATKSLTVGTSDTPNQNPTVDTLTVDGESAATVGRGDVVPLNVALTAGAAETYTDDEGAVQTEEPTVSYYVSAGTLTQSSASAEDAEVSWTAPESAGTARVWAVVRDGRGGMAWAEASAEVD